MSGTPKPAGEDAPTRELDLSDGKSPAMDGHHAESMHRGGSGA
jgi:hypothetical protein